MSCDKWTGMYDVFVKFNEKITTFVIW